MWARMSIRYLAALIFAIGVVSPLVATEPISALDLISADAALCLEIPNLNETWTTLDGSPILERLTEFPPASRFLQGRSFDQWRQVDAYIRATANQSLSQRFRSVFGKSLVLAMYATPDGNLQGILVGEAADDDSIDAAYETWNQLEPRQVTTNKSHHGIRYHERKRRPDQVSSLYFARSRRWFALTDREVLIHDVLDRFVALTSSGDRPKPEGSILTSPSFLVNRNRLKSNNAAYLHINGRAWDQILAGTAPSSSQLKPGEESTASIWKHVDSIGMSLRFDNGIVIDSSIQLDTNNPPKGWSKVVATASADSDHQKIIPPNALVAMTSHLEVKSFLPLIVNQFQSGNPPEFTKIRRVAKSLFGGQDLFDNVLPALARNCCGYVFVRPNERSKQLVVDGMIRAKLETDQNSNLLLDISQGLETTLTLLGAYFSSTSDNTTLVKHEHTGSGQLHWLTETAAYPFGFGVHDQTLIVAGSENILRKSFGPNPSDSHVSRLAEHSQRYFSSANQLFWFDTAEARRLSEQYGPDFTNLFDILSTNDVKGFTLLEPWLKVVDSLFVAGRIEPDHVRVTFGGGLDSK